MLHHQNFITKAEANQRWDVKLQITPLNGAGTLHTYTGIYAGNPHEAFRKAQGQAYLDGLLCAGTACTLADAIESDDTDNSLVEDERFSEWDVDVEIDYGGIHTRRAYTGILGLSKISALAIAKQLLVLDGLLPHGASPEGCTFTATQSHHHFAHRESLIGPTILLHSGRYFNFERPEETPISVEDIAHGLSNICRFTGQCATFYSVAQHAVLVSYLVPPELALQALHHDDVEAVMGDMASPLKKLIPQYKALENKIEAVIWAGLGLPTQMPPEIKQADLVALRTEQRDLMHIDGGKWPSLNGIAPAPAVIVPLAPDQARLMFLQRHGELVKRLARNQPD